MQSVGMWQHNFYDLKKIINLTVALSRQGHDFPLLKFTALMTKFSPVPDPPDPTAFWIRIRTEN